VVIGTLADINSIENSPAIGHIATFLGFVFLGFAGLWLLGNMLRRAEIYIIPQLPMLLFLGGAGIIIAGLLHHIGLW
jgi:hypothetical protein